MAKLPAFGSMSRSRMAPSTELSQGLSVIAKEKTARFNADIPISLHSAMTINRANHRENYDSVKDMAMAFIERGLLEDGYQFPENYVFHPTNANKVKPAE